MVDATTAHQHAVPPEQLGAQCTLDVPSTPGGRFQWTSSVGAHLLPRQMPELQLPQPFLAAPQGLPFCLLHSAPEL